jgi:hypothetical protein
MLMADPANKKKKKLSAKDLHDFMMSDKGKILARARQPLGTVKW